MASVTGTIRVEGFEGDAAFAIPKALRAFADAIERGDAAPREPYEARVSDVPARLPLAPRQRAVYEAIIAFHSEHSYMPTLRDLCARLQISSTHGAHEHLQALHRKGYIDYVPRTARGIRLL